MRYDWNKYSRNSHPVVPIQFMCGTQAGHGVSEIKANPKNKFSWVYFIIGSTALRVRICSTFWFGGKQVPKDLELLVVGLECITFVDGINLDSLVPLVLKQLHLNTLCPF
jgi:hypothetical protein